MKLYWIVLTFGLTSLFLVTTGIRLIENGYEQLNIVIQENVPENKSERLLARIEEIFRNASELLYKATHRRAYFKDVRVIIPKTWTKKDSYTIVSGISSSTSHIKVGNRRMALPFTVGSAKCGQEGMYIYLPYDQFILQENTTKWGKHDSVIIHEWGHLRWGLKDEYATIRKTETENPNTESGYSQVNRLPTNTINSDAIGGTWKHVSCHSGMDGYFAKDCSTGPDHFSCNAELPEIDDNCKFCPHMIQSVNSSLMGYQYIPSIVEFCDKNDSAIPEYMHHNSKATNEQNIYCEYKSAWEIMREHEDFKNGANPHLPDEQPPSTLFYFAQEISNKVIVLILDTSGSMAGPRIENLYLASKYLIEWALPNGSWVRLISFNTNASFLSEFIQITNETKQSLISRLPKFAEGFTCIPCGLDLALWALNHFQELGSTEGTEVILISDGFNNRGNLEIATQGCINKGVVVTCIAATEGADERLDIIRQETGGRYLYHSDLSSSSLATLFLEIVSGGLSADSSAETWIANYQLNATEDVSQNIIFNIDEGIGKDITVTILAKNTTNIDIRLSGPNNFTQTKSANGTDSLSLVVQGIGMQGQYTAEVTASSVSNIEAIITSRPTSIDVEVVRTTCRLSTNASDFNTSSHPIMYVYVRKGESPVRKAIVEGKIEDPDGKITCNISLFDDGNDPDMKPDDGIYSAVIHKGCQGKNGRHSSKVWIKGTAETVVTHYRSSGSAMIDPDANVAEDTPTGSFERVAFADAFTVINYDINITTKDTTPPGRITNIRLIDIQTDIPGTGLTRQYTIVWTATGDDFNNGQATAYDMRISNDQSLLRRDFLSAERLNVSGVDMAPNVSGKVERLQMTVSSNDAFTSTTYFAIVAIDEAGNRGKVSNIIPITVGLTSQIKAVEEECTDNCYAVVKDCGTNFKISNGRINFTNVVTKAGNFVPVVCDIGYELKGGESIKCLENGTWNGTVTCEIVGCGGVLIANGEVSFSNGTDYDATATVKCSDGYHLIGGNTARCMANGIWNKSSTCEINDCGRNVTIPHGQVGVDLTKARTTYGQSFPVICDTGYKLWGGVSIYCRADGRWSKTVTCKLIDCGATSVVNGQVDHSAGTHFNSTAKILCNSGYAKNGPGIITCLLSEKWSTDSNCTIKDCGTNVTILNGHVNLTDAVTTYGQSVPVNCDTGYELMGGTSIKCDANGRWEATTTCKIKDCGSISIANGEIDLSAGTKYNAVGTIQCDDGYWINGSSKVICLASGIWNSNTDCIRKDCGNYVSIPNGVVDFTNASTTVGHSVPITCETGYKLKGGTSVECGVDGQWSTIATCELIDCQPIRIANGEVQHTSDTKYNATASVNCHAGYQVQGSGILVCLHSGRWSNETKCIVKDCGRSERIANGQVDFNNKNTTYGTFAPVTCDLGYKLKGGSHIKCLADGTWSKRVSCEKVDCGKILIPNGIVSPFEGTKFNATAKVTCDLGFRTIDSDYVVCLHTGLWSKESPCTTVDCGSNINITNGRVNFTPGPTSYGHSANVICNTGFKLKGSAEVVCLAEGLWSTSPTCEIIDCDNNVSVSNGRPVFSGGRTTYGHFAEIICDKGYKLKGTGNISCLEDGTWSALPVCEIIDCGSNVSIVNGEVNFTGARTTYRHSIQVICETGYTIKGPINITCSANGRWSKLPVCERIDCGNSVNIINGQANFTNRNTTYGQIVPVFCYTGYELTAEAHITCLADGFWSKGPACDAIDVTPKSDARVNSTNIVVITASCFGLVALVIIGLLILTVIRTKQNRLLRKRHTREIPPDYSVDESTDERTFSTNKNEGWCIYNARGIQYINPNWNWRSRPANSENTQWPSYY